MTLAEKINSLGMVEVDAEDNEDGTTTIRLLNVNQDFQFDVRTSKDVWDYWVDFDVDEEVEMWLKAKHEGVQGIPNAVALVDEERQIEETLCKLATELQDYEKILKGV